MEGTIVLKQNSGSVRPETPGQAELCDRVTRLAHNLGGLCWRCSAQLAFGHQNGFASVHPPCASCAPVVQRLPVAKLNGWRTVAGIAADRRSWVALDADPHPDAAPGRSGAEIAADGGRRTRRAVSS